MDINNIDEKHIVKFNHAYTKLHGQKTGKLLSVVGVMPMELDNIPEETLLYDTDGLWQFEDGKSYLQLVFLGDKEIPFTTYREMTTKNLFKYAEHEGELFGFKVLNENK